MQTGFYRQRAGSRMRTFMALAASLLSVPRRGSSVRTAKCLSSTLITEAQQRVTLSCSLFNVIPAQSLHKYDVKFPIFTLYELRKHEATIFLSVSELRYGPYEFTRKVLKAPTLNYRIKWDQSKKKY